MTNTNTNFSETGIATKLNRALARAENVVAEYQSYLADMGIKDEEGFMQESVEMIREARELIQ